MSTAGVDRGQQPHAVHAETGALGWRAIDRPVPFPLDHRALAAIGILRVRQADRDGLVAGQLQRDRMLGVRADAFHAMRGSHEATRNLVAAEGRSLPGLRHELARHAPDIGPQAASRWPAPRRRSPPAAGCGLSLLFGASALSCDRILAHRRRCPPARPQNPAVHARPREPSSGAGCQPPTPTDPPRYSRPSRPS